MANKIFKKNIELFNYDVCFMIEPEYNKLIEVGSEFLSSDLNNEIGLRKSFEIREGFCLLNDAGEGLYVLCVLKSSWSNVPHECVHIAHDILNVMGASKDEEVMAYLVGYLSKWCFECIKEYVDERDKSKSEGCIEEEACGKEEEEV